MDYMHTPNEPDAANEPYEPGAACELHGPY